MNFRASFVGEERKTALQFPASPNKRPPSPQPPYLLSVPYSDSFAD